jgi:hypothetical protein
LTGRLGDPVGEVVDAGIARDRVQLVIIGYEAGLAGPVRD